MLNTAQLDLLLSQAEASPHLRPGYFSPDLESFRRGGAHLPFSISPVSQDAAFIASAKDTLTTVGAYALSGVDVLFDLTIFAQGFSSVSYQNFSSLADYSSFFAWFQFAAFGISIIWARGVGPRLRPDHLSDLTWKDFLLFLTGFLFFILVIALVL